MKKTLQIFATIICIMFCTCASAQVLTVKFTGRDQTGQHYVKLDHVKTFNLDQLWEEVLYFPDTTLVLGSVGIIDYSNSATSQLEQNVPNPFDGTTNFTLYLREEADVLLEIFDLMGKSVVNQHFTNLSTGAHLFSANLTNPQIYIMKVSVKNEQMHLKMVNRGYGSENSISYVSASVQNDDFESGAKDSQTMSVYPFQNGDELQYTGYAIINGVEYESRTITQQQEKNDTLKLRFNFSVPSVTTLLINPINNNSIQCGGNVFSDGGLPVIARGICWNTLSNPSINDNYTSEGVGIGSYTSTINDLVPGTNYYFRAYATNNVGTNYGLQRSYTIPIVIPTVTTSEVSNITDNSATCGGTVTFDGGATVTARGVCWSTSSNPTINYPYLVYAGSGEGGYNCTLTNLSPGTTYYVRAFATNSVGTAYGDQVIFTTNTVLPTVITRVVNDITCNSAKSGGVVTATGGASILDKGICWSNLPGPTISGNYISNGGGNIPDSYTNTLANLTSNTVYYVRAYATNIIGTAYGEQVCFNTDSIRSPTVNIQTINNITANSVRCICNISSSTCPEVIIRGICWGTENNPTTNDNHTTTNGESDSYTCNITGLSPGAIYYMRAYAINDMGTFYSSTIQITTLPYVTTSSVGNIANSSAICSGDITSYIPTIECGICWATSPLPTINNNRTLDSCGSGSFTNILTNLSPSTTYYVRAYATINSNIVAYGNQVTFTTPDDPCQGITTVTDYDGNVYNAIGIGSQCWMKENLHTTHYANGVYIESSNESSTSTAYRYTPNGGLNSPEIHGYLYNWVAVMHGSTSSSSNPSGVQGICPNGWHVPSDDEWVQLTDYVSTHQQFQCNDNNTQIAKALASSSSWWDSSQEPCAIGNHLSDNNATGFSALPAGCSFNYNGSFRHRAFFWSTTRDTDEDYYYWAYYHSLNFSTSTVGRGHYYIYQGLSVRCIRN